ncbi:vesicle transport protein USE1 [Octopus sinensis]|uniref:Vesicle transport protein USE1 n=1 Tax=Octopus sinensis TaxID=2607531 RepID=A0A6P7T819_9MOLL|nr:vesicle transport protein USE1 [Octopus sinensis]
MVATRLEVNMTRLMSRCEEKVAEKKMRDWRLEKYICALLSQLEELKKSPSCPSKEDINGYARKIQFLKGLLEADRLPDSSEKMLAAEKLAPVSSSKDINPSASKKLCNLTKGRYEKEMRADLFGNSDTSATGDLRQRKSTENDTDLDTILQHCNQMQGKLAEEMLMLTRNLKENVSAASRIVKDDLRTISDSSHLASSNFDKLKVQTEHLEAHTNSCTWWVWLMIAAVTLTFLWMIIFIRIFSK